MNTAKHASAPALGAHTPENPNKRRNLLRWQENRLRRLDGKIDREPTERRLARRHQLANAIQVAWAKRAEHSIA